MPLSISHAWACALYSFGHVEVVFVYGTHIAHWDRSLSTGHYQGLCILYWVHGGVMWKVGGGKWVFSRRILVLLVAVSRPTTVLAAWQYRTTHVFTARQHNLLCRELY